MSWQTLIAIAIVAIMIYILFIRQSQKQEGMIRYYIPYTRLQFGTSTGAPLFYSPVLMKQTNRCGDYGFNY